MSRPYAYLRKSSIHDPKRDTSPETQEREVRDLAERHGDEIAADAVLADWDISGRAKYTAKREQYQRLIRAIESGEASAVYSYSLSRLGRSTADLAVLFDLCAGRRVPLRLVVDAVDTSTASGKLLANVLASVAQFEAEVASERINASYATRRQKAVAAGEDPVEAVRSARQYGEVRTRIDEDGNQVTVGAAEDPDAVLRAYRESKSFGEAARRLNAAGVPSRDGKSWWASSVRVVIERLDPEVRVRRRETGVKRASSEGFALVRLLKCGTCGRFLTGGRLPDGKGGKRTRYACRYAENEPHPRVTITESKILPLVEAEAAHYRDPNGADTVDLDAERRRLMDERAAILKSMWSGRLRPEEEVRANEQLDIVGAELDRLDRPARPDFRMVAGMSPREVNDILRDLFEYIDIDPESFLPTHYEWRDPARRDDA